MESGFFESHAHSSKINWSVNTTNIENEDTWSQLWIFLICLVFSSLHFTTYYASEYLIGQNTSIESNGRDNGRDYVTQFERN